ncbi:hypothetical protein [Streptomyces sp. NPDC015345]|uniref:hypothetical protein n=1 Tax=Streptomyces sp. NPDC015345 TaxID=3364953 RepID=UPI0036F9B5A0
MDGTAIIILAIAGVVSVLLFALKGVLDQLPEVFDSASRARDAWKRFKEEQDEAAMPKETEQPPVADDDEPPMAA